MFITKKTVSFNVDPVTGDNNGWKFWDHVASNAWEPHTFEILNRFLSKEHSYIDVGAWIGPTVLFGSKLSKHCYAFEPDPKAFANLQANLNLNPDITNVSSYAMAIGADNGIVSMGTNSNQGDSMSSLLFRNNGSWEVESITLESFCHKFNIQDCNFIKMDIEGGENIVLPASKDFLQKVQPTLYLALHTGWISNKEEFFNNIKDTLSVYKNIYASSGQKISLDHLHTLPLFTEILATNLDWK